MQNGVMELKKPFQREQGHCWQIRLSEYEASADTGEKPQQSMLALYENDRQIGAAHSIHSHIREYGQGRYSHWGQYLYFSSTDNTDPNKNGRKYSVKVSQPLSPEELKSLIENTASDEAMLLHAVRANLNLNDRAMYTLLHCFRVVKYFCDSVGYDIAGKSILEIGSCKHPGLGLSLLLAGCGKYYANNMIPVNNYLPAEYAKLIYMFMTALLGVRPERLKEVTNYNGYEAEGERWHLQERNFVSLSPVPAEDMDLPDGSADMIFSMSVLEHVSRPGDVINKCFRLLRPGGWCFHIIDLNDHADYNKPLNFLRYTRDEYVAKTGGPENRLRASDFLKLFNTAGFESIKTRFSISPLKLTKSGKVELIDFLFQSFDGLWPYKDLNEIVPWVGTEMRDAFVSPYREKDLQDLSVLMMAVTCRKPE